MELRAVVPVDNSNDIDKEGEVRVRLRPLLP